MVGVSSVGNIVLNGDYNCLAHEASWFWFIWSLYGLCLNIMRSIKDWKLERNVTFINHKSEIS